MRRMLATTNKVAILVGLDYHSRTVRVCVLSDDGQVLLNRLEADWDNEW